MEQRIKKLLDSHNIKYKLVDHRKVYTAFNDAETQHIDPKAVVKTVFLKLSKPSLHVIEPLQKQEKIKTETIDTILVAVPAGKRVDLKKIAKAVNDHATKSYKLLTKVADKSARYKKPSPITAKMANEKDITKKLHTKVGLLHPFSQIFGLPLLLDKKLLKNKKITVPAGSYTQSIEISTKDFLKILVGMQGNFTE